MNLFLLDGWASDPDTWERCRFRRDRTFSYLDQLQGLPERALDEVGEAILVGFSMGGSSALRLYLRNPRQIRGLVLVSATPRMMADEATGWRGLSERRFAALRMAVEYGMAAQIRGEREARTATHSPLFSRNNLERGLRYLHETDLRSRLSAEKDESMGVYIFQSERDGIVHPSHADFLAKVFPQAVVTRVAGCEHALAKVVPERIDEAVEDCLKKMTMRA